MKNIFPIISFVIVLLTSGCEPQQDDALLLPPVPTNVSFSVTPSTTETNVFTFKNTTTETFLYQWDFGNGVTSNDENPGVQIYTQPGTYPVQYSGYNNSLLQNWVTRAGITKKITPHCCRNTFSAIHYDNYKDVGALMKILGHKDISTTQRYLAKFLKNIDVDVDLLPEFDLDF